MFIGWGYLLSGCGETKADKHFVQGYEYHQQSKLEEAIAKLQKVIGIDPNHLDAHVGLGKIEK